MPEVKEKAPEGQPPKQVPKKAKAKPKQKKELSEAEKNGRQVFFGILGTGIAFYLVIVLIIALLLWYSFSGNKNPTSLYSVRVVDAEENRLFSYDAVEANNTYGLYLRYSDLSKYCDFGVAGDDEKVTLFLPGDKDSVVCWRNSSLVQINGNTARIGEPVLFEGKDYLLPVSLFEKQLGGLFVSYDEDNKLCVVTIPDEIVFTPRMHEPEPLEECPNLPVEESSEPEESDE